ncbi:MAG: radical SAM protein [Ferrovibrio sp.]|uniref:radical SAM protein n=1 Tax=Ferrovibrio sp. TaxID=1917215 RepID=UPI00391D18CD
MSSPQSADSDLSIAESALQRGEDDAALQIFNSIVRNVETRASGWYGIARCMQALGRDEDALRPMLCALVYGFNDPQICSTVLQHLAQGDRAMRIVPVMQGLLPSPATASGLFGALAQQAASGDKEFRIELMRVAYQLDPGNPKWRRRLVSMLASSHCSVEIVRILDGVPEVELDPVERQTLAMARALLHEQDRLAQLELQLKDGTLDQVRRAQVMLQTNVAERSVNSLEFQLIARNTPYMDFPAYLHLETLAVCNAACNFCPYPTLERQGTRMSDELIAKILRDLEDIPSSIKFTIAPLKVSDPFLEKRLFSIMETAAERLPSASFSLITNGSAMTDRNLERLTGIQNIIQLSISLNDHRPEVYREVMGIPFERTVERMRALHKRYENRDYDFEVVVSRVSDGTPADLDFVKWGRREFPAFTFGLVPRNDWIGQMDLATSIDTVPDMGCNRWYMMSITATGKVALCCMDGEEKYVVGDVSKQHLLEIYNLPDYRIMRKTMASRRQAAAPCNGCTYV